MKTYLLKSVFILTLIGVALSCGSSKKAAEADRKKQEVKQKQEQLDQDKKRFEMQNKELK
ncbi:MAG: hypothetical protein ACHQK8_02360 [Bacteroidia bacterium]